MPLYPQSSESSICLSVAAFPTARLGNPPPRHLSLFHSQCPCDEDFAEAAFDQMKSTRQYWAGKAQVPSTGDMAYTAKSGESGSTGDVEYS